MYWSSNIKREEVERYGGRCAQASKNAEDERLHWFLAGSWAAMESLQFMDYGMDEESFLNYVTRRFQMLTMEDRDE